VTLQADGPVLTLLPIGLFFLAFQRFLVEGVATSGLGGA
jgi:multiple sugar transport system permease protein